MLFRSQPVFALPKIPVPERPPSPAKLGLLLEGADHAVFASPDGGVSTNPLPQFSKLTRRSYFVDVFNAGTEPLRWTVAPGADWIQLTRSAGGQDARIWVTIDWARAPAGNNVQGLIRFTADNQQSPVVLVSLFNPADPAPMLAADFVEDNHHIVAQAAHASAFLPGLDARWETIRGLGYNGAAVAVFPTLIPVRSDPQKIPAESPSLQFNLWMRHPGDWHFTVRALPAFSVEAGRPQRYAIALDNEAPKIVALPFSTGETDRRWQEDVLRNAAFGSSSHPVARPGPHTLRIWMVDPGIIIDTIAADDGQAPDPGYLWPPETRPVQK